MAVASGGINAPEPVRLFDPNPGGVLDEAAVATGFDHADDADVRGPRRITALDPHGREAQRFRQDCAAQSGQDILFKRRLLAEEMPDTPQVEVLDW